MTESISPEWKPGDPHRGWRCDSVRETPCEVCGQLYVRDFFHCPGPQRDDAPSPLAQAIGILRDSGRMP